MEVLIRDLILSQGSYKGTLRKAPVLEAGVTIKEPTRMLTHWEDQQCRFVATPKTEAEKEKIPLPDPRKRGSIGGGGMCGRSGDQEEIWLLQRAAGKTCPHTPT